MLKVPSLRGNRREGGGGAEGEEEEAGGEGNGLVLGVLYPVRGLHDRY
jgi:hypothetical protein